MTRYLGPDMTVDAALIRNLLAVLASAGIAFPRSLAASSAR